MSNWKEAEVPDDWRKRKPGRPRVKATIIKDWKKKREEGWTYRAIAIYWRVTETTVRRHLTGYYDDK